MIDIDALLDRRRNTHGQGADLRLQPGERPARSGWTRREVEAIGDWRAVVDLDAALRAHWVPIWEAEDEARAARTAEARRRAQVAQAEAHKVALAHAWAVCGVGRRYLGASFDDWSEDDLVARQVDWHPLIEGAPIGASYFNLVLHGPCGTGKTRLAAAWLRARCIEDEESCAFVAADALAREVVGARDRDRVLAKYAVFGALVIDDLCVSTGQGPEVMARHFGALEQVIDARNSDNLRTCFTSNASPEDMHDGAMFSTRCLSRLFDQALVLEVAGRDRRRQTIDTTRRLL